MGKKVMVDPVHVGIKVDRETLLACQRLKLNVSAFCRQALERYVDGSEDLQETNNSSQGLFDRALKLIKK